MYWNDLVQGPFEPTELVTLRAFTPELMVCPEESQDWVTVQHVPELACFFQAVTQNMPPPPPPSQPPSISTVQGEFFGDSPGQQTFGGSDTSASYSFKPMDPPAAIEDLALPPILSTPFRFGVIYPVEVPAETVKPSANGSTVSSTPDLSFIEEEAVEEGSREPEEQLTPEIDVEPQPWRPSPMLESPADWMSLREMLGTTAPTVSEPEVPTPEISSEDAFEEPSTLLEPAVPALSIETVEHVDVEEAPVLPPLELEPEKKLFGWRWIFGSVIFVSFIVGAFYVFLDRYTSRSAIQEVMKNHPLPRPPVVKMLKAVPPAVKTQVPGKKMKAKQAPKLVVVKKPTSMKQVPQKPVVVPTMKPLAKQTEAQAPIHTPAPTTTSLKSKDPWYGKEQGAISLVMKQKIYSGKRTIAENAKIMMQSMHNKELLHAAETGERLYLPDKLGWTSLREDGALYRVYLVFTALQGNGERTQYVAYQFHANMEYKQVVGIDDQTKRDFFDPSAMVISAPNAMATDIDTLLAGVDELNRQKLRAMIIKHGKNKGEKEALQAALFTAQMKVQKTIQYFRSRYPEKNLTNVAKAYNFSPLLGWTAPLQDTSKKKGAV